MVKIKWALKSLSLSLSILVSSIILSADPLCQNSEQEWVEAHPQTQTTKVWQVSDASEPPESSLSPVQNAQVIQFVVLRYLLLPFYLTVCLCSTERRMDDFWLLGNENHIHGRKEGWERKAERGGESQGWGHWTGVCSFCLPYDNILFIILLVSPC